MERKHPAVSVIVPNYNYARYLEKRLESILNQTFQDFELILLDDASTDDSVMILERYKNNPHVSHLVVNAENSGSPFQQWMKGILLAHGKWVWIAETDDLCELDFLETCMKQISKYSSVAVCMTASSNIDENGELLSECADYWGKQKFHILSRCISGKLYAEHNMYWGNCVVNASGVLFRRSYAVELVDTPALNMRYSGDWIFWFQMLLQGNMVEIYRKLNYFRQHNAKVSVEGVQSGNRIWEDIIVLRLMETALPEINHYKRRLARGRILRKIKKVKDEVRRNELITHFRDRLGGDSSDLNLLHWNQYLKWIFPWLLTVKRDRV